MHGTHLLGFHELADTAGVDLTVHISTRAFQTIHEEIQAHRPGIEVLGYETGGGIFGPPIRSWHRRADIAIATVAAGPRKRNAVEIAYGKIEATEASLIRVQGSQFRRIGDWHLHPTCPPGHVGEPSDTDMDGVQKVGVHSLRHSTAALLLAAGVPLPKVSEIMRHANVGITASTYAGLLESQRAELKADLEAALRVR